jgi:putative oxidoreductase
VTPLAAILLVIDMVVALLATKLPILVEKGFWAMAHETLLVVGAGPRSIDARLPQAGVRCGSARPSRG